MVPAGTTKVTRTFRGLLARVVRFGANGRTRRSRVMLKRSPDAATLGGKANDAESTGWSATTTAGKLESGCAAVLFPDPSEAFPVWLLPKLPEMFNSVPGGAPLSTIASADTVTLSPARTTSLKASNAFVLTTSHRSTASDSPSAPSVLDDAREAHDVDRPLHTAASLEVLEEIATLPVNLSWSFRPSRSRTTVPWATPEGTCSVRSTCTTWPGLASVQFPTERPAAIRNPIVACGPAVATAGDVASATEWT
mmetsp:Transcript_15442/g.58456  ORF Transcript_15442/g.58456 Transcript_15442/m.58456 type:complete len:252 (+) Transcript_15442:5454-6209(+)